jgi:hypothetical protein
VIGLRAGQAKGLFFDSKKVMAATTKAERRVLSRFGAYVRRSARSSIRKRKGTSAPGQPPSSHTGLLKRFIFFAYEPRRRSVVIGPARLNQKTGEALPALEHGGPVRIVSRRKVARRRRIIRIRPRPFMGPAFEREKPKLPAMWRDSIR